MWTFEILKVFLEPTNLSFLTQFSSPGLLHVYVPEAELIAEYAGFGVSEMIIADCAPRSLVHNFQTAFSGRFRISQSH